MKHPVKHPVKHTEPTAQASRDPNAKPPLIVLLGPTAVGKTALSLDLAQAFQGEIVSADSRQIYRGMDIGTAKPTPEERRRVPHHLLDIREPDQPLSLAEYQALAVQAIQEIHARGRTPFLVGGTALYVKAVVTGMRIPDVPPDPALRQELETLAREQGAHALHGRLQELDPVAAARIHPHNVRRVIRALEIVLRTGRPKSELEGAEPPPFRSLLVGLDMPREQLHARIQARIQRMIQAGWVTETERLLAAGYPENLPALTSLGYRELVAHLRGELSLEEAVQRIRVETHRFVRHQYTWFRRMEGVHWFDMSRAPQTAIRELVAAFLAQEGGEHVPG